MEGRPAETPLKVCPHCSVASRTDADECPSCGRSYVRRGVQWWPGWRWWFAIPIVAAAFLIGLLVIGPLIRDDSGEEAITLEQGAAVPEGTARSELEGHLDGLEPAFVEPRPGEPNTSCAYYLVTDQPETVWEFCFRMEELVSSAPLGGGAVP